MRVSKSRAEMFADEDGLLLGGHPHAGIVSRNIPRFVLGSNRKDGHSGLFVGLHEAHEVACKRREGRRQQRATNHGPGGFHPSGGLQGLAMILSLGLTASASRRTGIMYARSRSMVKRISSGSDFPSGMSS